MMTRASSILVLALVGSASLVPPVFAEHQCSSSLSYVWIREKEERKVDWSTVTFSGESEEGAKTRLLEIVEREKKAALGKCREEHENLSGCVAAKYAALQGVYGTLGFEVRRSIDE